MVRGSSMSIAPVPGGGGQESVDHLRRCGLADLGERGDLEEVLETFLGGFALIALPGHEPEQVPALGLAHRLHTIPSLGRPGRRVAMRPCRRGGWPRWLIPRRVSTRSGVRGPALADAVQLLEGDDTDIDGV